MPTTKNVEKTMWKRIIKYLINFAGISLMIFYASVSYGIMARLPPLPHESFRVAMVFGLSTSFYD